MSLLNKNFLFLSATFFFCSMSLSQAGSIDFKGYYKNLFTTSKTSDTQEGICSDLQRLRIDGQSRITPHWQARVVLDEALLLNDFAATSTFESIKSKSQRRTQWVNTEALSNDHTHVYNTLSLYRGYLKYDNNDVQVTIGKQAIDWGRTRFWSPLDLFNPISPLEIERDERIGVDAINAEFPLNTALKMNTIYAPHRTFKKSSIGTRIYTHWNNYDLFAVGGTFQDNVTGGLGFDGSIGGSEIRGELTQTHSSTGRDFVRGVVGWEHSFANKITVVSEYFYNGGADRNNPNFFTSYTISSRLMSIRRNLVGLGLGYEITPLIKFDNNFIYDIDGKSAFYNPEIRYNIKRNLDIALGAQLLWGKAGTSEFGSYENLYYLELKLYF